MKRVWIIQEVLVARDVMVVWGSEKFPWKLIAKVMSFFLTTGWHLYITTLHFKSLPVVVENAGIYTQMPQERLLDINLILEQIRREVVRHGASSDLPKLVSMFRDSKASDPRDKIYALLNLANKESLLFRKYPEALIADYIISTRELFIKVTRIFLRAYPNLRHLFLVEDAALRQIHDLPSWVPDYIVPLRPLSPSHRGYFKYNASPLAAAKCCGGPLRNHINAQYPAPKSTNSIFFKWLCIWVVARRFVWEENLDAMNPITSIRRKKEWEKFLELIRRLLELEPAGSELQLTALQTLLGDMILSTNYWRYFDRFKPVYMDCGHLSWLIIMARGVTSKIALIDSGWDRVRWRLGMKYGL